MDWAVVMNNRDIDYMVVKRGLRQDEAKTLAQEIRQLVDPTLTRVWVGVDDGR